MFQIITEIHIFWAQHQVHHSSEEYHLGVALRQSLLQEWCGFVSKIVIDFYQYNIKVLIKLPLIPRSYIII